VAIETKYVGAELVVILPYEVANIVAGSVVVYLANEGTTGTPGDVVYLESGGYTLAAPDLVDGTSLLTIPAGQEIRTNVALDKASVHIGYLAKNAERENTLIEIDDAKQINDFISKSTLDPSRQWFNPLVFGASMLFQNGASKFYAGVTAKGSAVSTGVTLFEGALDVYSIAVLSSLEADITAFKSHATAMSAPEEKGERIVIGSVAGIADYESGTKAENATALKNWAMGQGEKRLFNIHPEVAYVRMTNANLGTLTTAFITAAFGATFAGAHRPIWVASATDGSYQKGDSVTDAQITTIKAVSTTTKVEVDVLIPVPGYYMAAALAGKISVNTPSQPLTNSSIAGFSKLEFSNKYFKNSDLNTIASGGNLIMEDVGGLLIRHQLSTNALTAQTRELSITTAIDYSAKFLRDFVSPLIGKFVISPALTKNLTAAFNSAANVLIDNGIVADLKLDNLFQDPDAPSTLKVDFSLKLLYPLNYIKITLTF